MELRYQNTCSNNYTAKEEGNLMCNNLPSNEECVNEVNLLPDSASRCITKQGYLDRRTSDLLESNESRGWNRITETSPIKTNFEHCILATTGCCAFAVRWICLTQESFNIKMSIAGLYLAVLHKWSERLKLKFSFTRARGGHASNDAVI